MENTYLIIDNTGCVHAHIKARTEIEAEVKYVKGLPGVTINDIRALKQ